MSTKYQQGLKIVYIHAALAEYLARQKRTRSPHGWTDESGIWWPTEDEEQTCCAAIRPPTKAWPDGLFTHCCSLRHVANLYGVSDEALRRALEELRKPHQNIARES